MELIRFGDVDYVRIANPRRLCGFALLAAREFDPVQHRLYVPASAPVDPDPTTPESSGQSAVTFDEEHDAKRAEVNAPAVDPAAKSKRRR